MMIMVEMMIARRCNDDHDDNDADGDAKNVHDAARRMHDRTPNIWQLVGAIGAIRSKWNGALVELLFDTG